MRNFKVFLLTTSILISCGAAHADEFGGALELGVWNTTQRSIDNLSSSENVFMLSGYFEHPMPFIPNLRFDALTINSETISVSQSAFTGYYQLLDNGNVEFDLGAGITAAYNGSFTRSHGEKGGFKKKISDIDDAMPHVYLGGRIAVPFINNLNVFSNYYMYRGKRSRGSDARVGVMYDLSAPYVGDMILRAGYRKIDGDFLHHAKSLNSDGAFVSFGVSV